MFVSSLISQKKKTAGNFSNFLMIIGIFWFSRNLNEHKNVQYQNENISLSISFFEMKLRNQFFSLKIKKENNILASFFKNENSWQSLLPPSIKKPLIASLDIFSLRFFGGSVTLCHLHCHDCQSCLCHHFWSRAGNTSHIVDTKI